MTVLGAGKVESMSENPYQSPRATDTRIGQTQHPHQPRSTLAVLWWLSFLTPLWIVLSGWRGPLRLVSVLLLAGLIGCCLSIALMNVPLATRVGWIAATLVLMAAEIIAIDVIGMAGVFG